MRIYELILVLKASLSETERKKTIDNIKKILKELKLVREEAWGKKELTFKIKKETTGYFVSLLLEGETIPLGYEKKLIDNDILRHLLIRKK